MKNPCIAPMYIFLKFRFIAFYLIVNSNFYQVKNSYFIFIFIFFILFIYLFVVNFVIHWNKTVLGLHVFPIPIPPPTSLSTRSP